MNVDPITLEVLRNGVEAVAEEMNANLVRSAYSPNIKERRDCSCAIFDATGAMIAQAENIPVHLGAMPFSVESALDAFPIESLEPGDGILLNDPFRGGAHLPDLTLVTPIFVDGSVRAIAANRAHHADIGGATAGSVSAQSTDIYQEGLRLPPVRLFRSGTVDRDIQGIVLSNTRSPAERRGDLRAQQAANETGIRRLNDLIDRHGTDTYVAAVAELLAYSERRMRAAIAGIPDGEYAFEDVIEDDGRGNTDIRIRVTVTVSDSEIAVDFTDTAPQTDGALNAVFAVTASATYYAIRCVTDPSIPPNAGCYRPIAIHAPARSIVNAEQPAPVVGGNLETSQRIVDVLFGAFAEAVPEGTIAASQGTMNNVTFGGIDPRTDEAFTFYETQAGGGGARPQKDGIDAVQVHMTNTLNTPVEVIQTAYPLAVTRYELRRDSGGDGEYRGGLGLRRDIEVRAPKTAVSLLAERRRVRPYGIDGGQPGQPGEDVIIVDGAAETIPAKATRIVDEGTVISIRTPGGGGYGDPSARRPEDVDRDIELGKVSSANGTDLADELLERS